MLSHARPLAASARRVAPAVAAVPARNLFGGLLPNLGSNASGQRRHTESCVVPYAEERVFDVVADIAAYRSFLPWCTGSRVLRDSGSYQEAELVIGFPPLTERFTSRVTLERPRAIRVDVPAGSLFHHLRTTWAFSPGPSPGTTRMELSIDFHFRSALHSALTDMFFREVLMGTRSAFVNRVHAVCAADAHHAHLASSPSASASSSG